MLGNFVKSLASRNFQIIACKHGPNQSVVFVVTITFQHGVKREGQT